MNDTTGLLPPENADDLIPRSVLPTRMRLRAAVRASDGTVTELYPDDGPYEHGFDAGFLMGLATAKKLMGNL